MSATLKTNVVPVAVEAGSLFAGRYKLREKLGEGGMGSVWVADQVQPVQRRVALKVMKAGLDSRELLARFEQERQALALMDHPNVAKVLDAGVSGEPGASAPGVPPAAHAAGSPFFVMELIKGVPLTDYCDDAKLSIRDRLALFIPVCQAVQHAHQKGVIHRDLKPGNLLVGLYDGKPVPKVIDFGIAKAVGQRVAASTIYTEVGQIIGTLEYMSPEQAELNNLDIDTRSDIYALGVILYEQLTGSVPFHRSVLAESGLAEMLRVIKEVEPEKPSTKLTKSFTPPRVAAARQLEPAKLASTLKGDLDWIVMKCLEKERGRRYDSANQLADDLQRYLKDEPVEAGPPSAGYRLAKFYKRHRAAVLAGGGGILLQLLAVVVSTVFALWALRSERQAIQDRDAKNNALIAEKAAKEDSQTRLKQAEQANSLLLSLFEDLNPDAAALASTSLVDLLGDRLVVVAQKLKTETASDPQRLAELQNRLGTTFLSLGRAKDAKPLLTSAVALATRTQGPEHPTTLSCLSNLANAETDLGNYAAALKLYQQVHDGRRKVLGPTAPEVFLALMGMANCYSALGDDAKALPLHEQVLEHHRRVLGPEEPTTLMQLSNLANCLGNLGRAREALKLREEAQAGFTKTMGPEHPFTLTAQHNVGRNLIMLGRYADAVKLNEQTLEARRRKLGPRHADTLSSMNSLAASYFHVGRHADAIRTWEEALAALTAALGADHPETLTALGNLAIAHMALKQYDDALKLLTKSLELRRQRFGDRHPQTLQVYPHLAGIHARMAERASNPQVRAHHLAEAMKLLQAAVAAGSRDVDMLKHEPDLEPLRARQDFQALLKTASVERQLDVE